MLTFIKRTSVSWQHQKDTQIVSFGGGVPIFNDTDNTVVFQTPNGTNFPIAPVLITDCKIINKTDGDAEFAYTTTTEFWDKLIELNYPFINTGVIGSTSNLQLVTDAGNTTTNSIIARAQIVSSSDDTKGVSIEDEGVFINTTGISGQTGQIKTDDLTNDELFQLPDKSGAGGTFAMLDDITGSSVSSFNTRTGAVTPQTGDYTTAQLTESTDKKFVTDAQLVVISNTIGTNTGDNATNSQYSGLATSKADVDGTFGLIFHCAASNISDNATLYMGGSNNLILSATNNRFETAGITSSKLRATIFIYNTGTLGTSEDLSITLMNVTQGTEILLTSTAKTNSTSYNHQTGQLTFAITQGDNLAIRLNSTAIATNPTNVLFGARVMQIK